MNHADRLHNRPVRVKFNVPRPTHNM
jgi:hypothetical protein